MLLEFQNKANIEVVGIKLKHSGFPSVSSDMDLGNIEFLDTHLDFLDTDILSKPSASLQDVLKRSSTYVFKTSSRHVFKTSSRNVFKAS